MCCDVTEFVYANTIILFNLNYKLTAFKHTRYILRYSVPQLFPVAAQADVVAFKLDIFRNRNLWGIGVTQGFPTFWRRATHIFEVRVMN